MDFSITPSAKVFRSYQTQERYGELNKKLSVKIVQGQVDTVSISSKALEYFEKGPPPESVSNFESSVEPRVVDETSVEKPEGGFQAFDFGSPEFSPT